ncbi:hypothetical protein CP533_2232 [Ophiocordyceps camponoti-saundersi (nom. inval.)]|nr:hypothetical protein CP533_2232 [Ophiocordyceps camponoti-saundersi (nom. inval.)]
MHTHQDSSSFITAFDDTYKQSNVSLVCAIALWAVIWPLYSLFSRPARARCSQSAVRSSVNSSGSYCSPPPRKPGADGSSRRLPSAAFDHLALVCLLIPTAIRAGLNNLRGCRAIAVGLFLGS